MGLSTARDHRPNGLIHIEAWPHDQLVHIYNRQASPEPVEAIPVDALAGFYRLESEISHHSVLWGFKWLGPGGSLPSYAELAEADADWPDWISQQEWEQVRHAWDLGAPYQAPQNKQ